MFGRGHISPWKINHEETKRAKKEQKKNFALFVSSWLMFVLSPTSLAVAMNFLAIISVHPV
jgi:hypothetical protein